MACSVLPPMAVCGSTRSMAARRVARENRAAALVSTPGAMTPPMKRPSRSTTSMFVAVPKSTTTTGAP